jgi:hypothetical protein
MVDERNVSGWAFATHADTAAERTEPQTMQILHLFISPSCIEIDLLADPPINQYLERLASAGIVIPFIHPDDAAESFSSCALRGW